MVQLVDKTQLTCKLVYYGPAEADPSGSLRHLHARTPAARRGALTMVDADGGRPLPVPFAFTTLDLGRIGGVRVRLHVTSVPARCSPSLHDRLLRDVDGVVFVAHGDAARPELDQRAWSELQATLERRGRERPRLVVQASHPKGYGVTSAFKQLVEQVLEVLSRDHGLGAPAPASAPVRHAPAAAAPAPRAAPEPARRETRRFEVVGTRAPTRRRGLARLLAAGVAFTAGATNLIS